MDGRRVSWEPVRASGVPGVFGRASASLPTVHTAAPWAEQADEHAGTLWGFSDHTPPPLNVLMVIFPGQGEVCVFPRDN